MKTIDSMKHILLLFVFVATGSISYGQYQGPGTTDKTYTVQEIKNNASRLDRMDALVKIEGFIIKQINKDTYEFRDDTGTILLDLDKKKLPAEPFDDKTRLVILGEVDHDTLEPVEFEVEEIRFQSTRQ